MIIRIDKVGLKIIIIIKKTRIKALIDDAFNKELIDS